MSFLSVLYTFIFLLHHFSFVLCMHCIFSTYFEWLLLLSLYNFSFAMYTFHLLQNYIRKIVNFHLLQRIPLVQTMIRFFFQIQYRSHSRSLCNLYNYSVQWLLFAKVGLSKKKKKDKNGDECTLFMVPCKPCLEGLDKSGNSKMNDYQTIDYILFITTAYLYVDSTELFFSLLTSLCFKWSCTEHHKGEHLTNEIRHSEPS